MNTDDLASSCRRCKFFHVHAANIQTGDCMRYPPVPYPAPGPGGKMGVITVFPAVAGNQDACGEYQEKALRTV